MACLNVFSGSLKNRNLDRNFIMLGKICSGKSTLSNFLVGYKDISLFPTHVLKEAKGKTNRVKNRKIVYSPLDRSEKLTFQITDLPGTNDSKVTDRKLCQFIVQSIKESRAQLSDTFLIVCNIITGKFFADEEMTSILNIAEILADSGYMLFENAILVFTHADLVHEPERTLREKIKTEEWAGIGQLLECIDNRHLFVRSKDLSERNRDCVIKKLFELSKPTLNVAFTGNSAFKCWELRMQLSYTTLIQKDSEKYTLKYFFNPDLKILQRFTRMNYEQRVVDEMKKLSTISKGISVMVILISLEVAFSEDLFDGIIHIPDTYLIQQSDKIICDPLWKFSFILFLAPKDDKIDVERYLNRSSNLKTILLRVNNRFTWVTRDMQPEECHARIIDMVFKVKHQTQGASYIDSNIVIGLNKMIEASIRAKHQNDLVSQGNAIQGENNFEFPKDIPLFIRANTFNWNQDEDEISRLMAYFLVQKVKPEASNTFLEMYPDQSTPLPKTKFMEFCLQYLF